MFNGFKTGFWLGAGLILVLTLSTTAGASTVEKPTETTAATTSQPIYLSLSMNEGTSSLSNPVPGSTSNSGSRTELLLLASVELNRWVLEAGGGWLHDSLSGQANPSTFGVTDFDVVTDAGVAEVSPQYRIVDHLRIGPVAELLVGPDVSFSATVIGSDKHTAWLGGGQALYEFRLGQTALRAGARYLTSLDLADHQLQSVQATLQVGLPVMSL
jgi:hypothetical protein